MIDENIAWEDHIKTVEKKLAKNLGLLYRAKHLVDNDYLKTIYLSYTHSYLNYASIALRGTCFFTMSRAIHY